MTPLKIAPLFLIISIGIIGAFFIANNSPAASSQPAQTVAGKIENPLSENPYQLVNNSDIGKNLENNTGALPFKNSGTIGRSDLSSANFTQASAQALFQGIQALDGTGNNPFQSDPNDPNVKQVINQSVDAANAQNYPFPSREADIKISYDNSKNAKTSYLKKIKETFNQIMADKAFLVTSINKFDDIANDFNEDCIKDGTSLNNQRAKLFGDLLEAFLKIPVPSDWFDSKKQVVDFYVKTQLIFQSMANCNSDPIKAYALLQQLPGAITDGLNISKIEKAHYEEVGLTYP